MCNAHSIFFKKIFFIAKIVYYNYIYYLDTVLKSFKMINSAK